MKECFVLRTTSVSPLDRDKDTVLDPRKMHAHFSVFQSFNIKKAALSDRLHK